MGNPTAGIREVKRVQPPERIGWQALATLPGLLDVSIVRAELARLRGPHPATELPRPRAKGLTVYGER